MSDKEILEKAIQKAIDGGWLTVWCGTMAGWRVEINQVTKKLFIVSSLLGQEVAIVKPEEVIFNHDFAKALWKSPKKPKYIWQPKESGLWEYDGGYMPDFIGEKWEYHLQQMVISDNPIKYLGENI